MAVTRVSGTSVGGTATTTNLDSSSAGLGDDIFRLVTIVRPSTSTITPPAGWATVLDTTTNTQSARIYIAYHWCTAAEVTANTTFTWTYSAGETYTFRSSHHSGVDPNDPISVDPIVANRSAATSWTTVPGLTTLVDGELTYWLMAHGTAANVGTQTLTLGSGSENWFVEGATVRGGTGSATGYASITAWEQRPTAGAVSERTVSASTSGAWRGYVLSLKPEATFATITGTAALTLPAPTITAAGVVIAQVVTGVSAVALGAAAVTAVGRRTTFGTAAATLAAPTITAAGHERHTGTATVALGGVTVSGTGTITQPPPGALYDLERWHLTTPADDGGEAEQIDQPALDTYSSEFFFIDGDGDMVFVAPTEGETTSGSDATRAELREHEDGSYANSAWDPLTTGRRQLTTASRVDGTSITGGTLPRQEVIFFQIHGASGTPPIYLTAEWTSSGNPLGTPRVRMFVSGTGMSNANLVTGISPTTDIAVRCRVEDGALSLWCVLGTEEDLPSIDTTPTFHVPDVGDFNDTTAWYFKHGAYNKTTVASGSSGEAITQTSFFELLQPGDADPPTVRTGTVAIALPGPTATVTGSRVVPGTAAMTAGGLNVAAVGTRATPGSLSVALPAPNVAAVGLRTTPGTSEVVLGGLIVSAAGEVVAEVVSGSASVALDAPTLALTGTRIISGLTTVALGALGVVAAGTVVVEVVTGSAVAQLGALSVTTAGERTVIASAAVDLGALSLVATGEGTAETVTGTAVVSLGQLSVTAAGTVVAEVVAGSAHVALAGPVITVEGTRAVSGTAAVTLLQLALTALGVGHQPAQPPWGAGEPIPAPAPVAVGATSALGLRAGAPYRS